MNYFLWNGVNSLTHGVVAEKLPEAGRDKERVEKVVIPGRSGHLTISDDVYDGSVMAVTCGLTDLTKRDTILAWLRGSGTVVFSNDLTHSHRARITDAVEVERVSDNFKQLIVLFDCQPFRYEATPATDTLTVSGSVTNAGNMVSLPIIKVTGSGVLTINGTAYTITATAGEAYVTINSEIEECYYGALNRNNKVSGGFPTLAVGANTITLGAGITQVEITRNDRWY